MSTSEFFQELGYALLAHLSPVVISTSDISNTVDETIAGLQSLQHIVSTWDPIFGLRVGDIDDLATMPLLPEPDGAGNAEPGTALIEWLEHLNEGPNYQFFPESELYAQVDGGISPEAKECPRTLVIRGIFPWLDASSQLYDVHVVAALEAIREHDMRESTNTVLVLPMGSKMPPELKDITRVIDDPYPDRKEIYTCIWVEFLNGCPDAYTAPLQKAKNVGLLAADNLAGLSRPQIRDALTDGLVRSAATDKPVKTFLDNLRKAKVAGIRESGALELLEGIPIEQVGGLDQLKEWLKNRAVAFSADAREAKIPLPRGCLLLGLPGGGKSLIAKAISTMLGFPLLRLDVGALFGSFVGDSEANARKALKVIDAATPCVLMLDEIEKAFAGSGGGSTDGGTTQRVFGTFLTWMQERSSNDHPCFIVGTANNVAALPPELLRKGRFDEIFFVDTPNATERRQIFEIHIKKLFNGVEEDPTTAIGEPELAQLIAKSRGYVGAEIEAALVEARINSFASGQPFDAHAILAALAATTPLSTTMAEKINELRAWAHTRARLATTPVEGGPPAAPTSPLGKKRKHGLSFNL